MRKELLAATAIVTVLGLGAAWAQSGGEARSNDRKIEKQLDDRKLTPIQPIRRVGPNDWPAAKDQAVTGEPGKPDSAGAQAANQPKETTGQAPEGRATANPPENKHPARVNTGNDTNVGTPQNPQANPPENKNPQRTQDGKAPLPPQGEQAPQPNRQAGQAGQSAETFANIRLGTDAGGRVAINDDQERQISAALRRHRVKPIERSDLSVKIGVVVPGDVRLGSVTADIVEVLPQFRGYSFFATAEDIVIVEPSARTIAALIPVKVTATASTAPAPQRSPETSARTTTSKRVQRDITVGSRLPDDIPIYPLRPGALEQSGRSSTVVIERRPRSYIFEDDDD